MSEIAIKIVNESNDKNNSRIVIFQKNVAAEFDELVVAWKVLPSLSKTGVVNLTIPDEFHIAAANPKGQVLSSILPSSYGQEYSLVYEFTSQRLQYSGVSALNEVRLYNELTLESINAQIYKEGKLLAVERDIGPEEHATFEVPKAIYIAQVDDVQEGDLIHISDGEAIKFDLHDIETADIVITGGGVQPIQFELKPYVKY